MMPMILRTALLGAVLSAGVLASGCFGTLEGRTKAGIPFQRDRIEGRYERPVDQVLASARQVLLQTGTLNSDDSVNKTLVAKIDTRTVWVKVDEVEPRVCRVIVQARKRGGASDIALASEIEKRIALGLVVAP